MSDDRRLLESFVRGGSHQALEALIRRHLGLVYSAALGQVRDPNLAEDVTQAVFLVLTRKAGTIRSGVAVGGWLLAVTRSVVVSAMRKKAIDKKHELRAAKPEAVLAAVEEWEEIAPRLDAELNRLPRVDRDAVVLRFFENRSFGEIGAELGLTEEAARKRVGRALERLRTGINGRKRSTTAGALALAMGAFAIQSAPRHLLAGNLASIVTPTPHCASLATEAMKMIAYAKARLIGAIGISAMLGAIAILFLAGVFHGTPAKDAAASTGSPAPVEIAAAPDPNLITINMDEPTPTFGGADLPVGTVIGGGGAVGIGPQSTDLSALPGTRVGGGRPMGIGAIVVPGGTLVLPGDDGP